MESDQRVDMRMGKVYVPDRTSAVEIQRLRELLGMFQTGVTAENQYVQDFMQASFVCMAVCVVLR